MGRSEPRHELKGRDGSRWGVFARGRYFSLHAREGFRFFGRLIKPGEGETTVELTRIGEQPTREMRMLPDPIPLEESRALARRLIEPYWKKAVSAGNPTAARRALEALAPADPLGVLEKLATESVLAPMAVTQVKLRVARALARDDTKRAQEVADSLESPGDRVTALVAVADALPAHERDRKLTLLAHAASQLKEANSQFLAAEVADRWYELGEKDKARTLFAASVRLRKDALGFRARLFPARLARVDLPAALAIAKELPARDRNDINQFYWNIALRLAGEKPVDSDRVLRLVPQTPGRLWLPPSILWKMAAADPKRARRLADESRRIHDSPQTYLFLALALKRRDPAAADEAIRKAMEGIDRLIEEGTENSGNTIEHRLMLPLIEQISPSLVPEFFWRTVAMRPPTGNPRAIVDEPPGHLISRLAWYDRDVAAVLFQPVRALLDNADSADVPEMTSAFVACPFSIPAPRRPGSTRYQSRPGLRQVTPGSELPRFSLFPTNNVGSGPGTRRRY